MILIITVAAIILATLTWFLFRSLIKNGYATSDRPWHYLFGLSQGEYPQEKIE